MTRADPPPADASLQPLIDVLDALIQVLEQDGDTHWSAWMRRAKSRLAQGDDRGADDLLGAYGGMGSFNDLILGQSYQDGRFAWKPGYAETQRAVGRLARPRLGAGATDPAASRLSP